MRRAFVLGTLLIASGLAYAEAGNSPAAPLPSAGCTRTGLETGERLERSIDVDGVARAYILDAPPTLKAGKPAPLLLDFHGFGHSGAGVWRVSQFRPLGIRDGFLSVYPEGLPVHLLGRDGAGWEIFVLSGNRDLAFVSRLLDRLEQDYCIDRSRVYATGFSNGGFLSHILACAMSDRIAAIAPVGGGLPQISCMPKRPVPVVIHHGSVDRVVPVASARAARDMWLERNGCGPSSNADGTCQRYDSCRGDAVVEYCEGSYDHTWPSDATDRIWSFLRSHSLPAGALADGR